MSLDSVPPYPTNLVENGIPTNHVLNRTPSGEFQIARVLKESEFEILFTSQSLEECKDFWREQVEREFPGLLQQGR
jgi:hypothetical protein